MGNYLGFFSSCTTLYTSSKNPFVFTSLSGFLASHCQFSRVLHCTRRQKITAHLIHYPSFGEVVPVFSCTTLYTSSKNPFVFTSFYGFLWRMYFFCILRVRKTLSF